MNEQLLKQLVRQMKIMNFWITLFGTIFLAAFIVAGFFVWQLVGVIRTTNQKLENVTNNVSSSINVKQQVCSGTSNFSQVIKSTGACD